MILVAPYYKSETEYTLGIISGGSLFLLFIVLEMVGSAILSVQEIQLFQNSPRVSI